MDGNHNRNIEKKQETSEQTGNLGRISNEALGNLTSESQKQILADMRGTTRPASEHLPGFSILDKGKPDKPAQPLEPFECSKAASSLGKSDFDKNGSPRETELSFPVDGDNPITIKAPTETEKGMSHQGTEPGSMGENLYSGKDPGKLETWHLKDQASGIFSKNDSNHDNRLDTSELAAAVANPAYTGKDGQLIAALYADRTAIEGMVNDGGNGISMDDIKAVENRASMEDVNGMLHWFNHKARNKPYTKDELEQVTGQSDIEPMHRNGLRYLADNFDQIAGADGSIDKGDIRNFAQNTPMEGGSLNIRNTIAKTYESEVKSGGSLFGKGDLLKHIVPEAVKQGDGVGDCYFMSAVAAVAAQRPQDIQNMIKPNDDGSFTVTFPGAKNEPITVERPTPAEMGLYATGTEHGIWPAVLEKAYGQYADQHFWRRNYTEVAGGNTVQESANGGEGQFSLGNGLELMTGHPVDNDIYSVDFFAWSAPLPVNSMEGARTKLEDAMQDDRAVLARFEHHVAAVRAFDPNGADGGTLTIYDQDNTQFDVSLKEFLKKGHSFTYEQKPSQAQ